MGAQPATLASNLVAATQSTDHTAPTATITSPAAGASIGNGSVITVPGTATDAGGGVVAGVEVSLDGGATWHPRHRDHDVDLHRLAGRDGVRADQGPGRRRQRQPPDDGRPGHVTVACPCSMFGLTTDRLVRAPRTRPRRRIHGHRGGHQVPHRHQRLHHRRPVLQGHRQHRHPHRQPVELDRSAAGHGDLHQRVRHAAGRRPTSPRPVAVTAGTTYVVSYYAPAGHYASSEAYFKVSGSAQGPIRGPGRRRRRPQRRLHLRRRRLPDQHASTPPTTGSTPLFTAGVAGRHHPADGHGHHAGQRHVERGHAVAPTVTFSEPVQPATVSFTVTELGRQHGRRFDRLQLPTTSTATFTPDRAPGRRDHLHRGGERGQGPGRQHHDRGDDAGRSRPPTRPTRRGCARAASGTTPSVPGHHQRGRRQRGGAGRPVHAPTWTAPSPASGSTRDRRTPAPTPVSCGRPAGTKLATATFTAESTSGWQQVNFSTPVSITAGTTYVASYHTNAGNYSLTAGQFIVDRRGQRAAARPGHARARPATGSTPTARPRPSRRARTTARNYWVDVVFSPTADVTPPTVVSHHAGQRRHRTCRCRPRRSATMSEPLQSGTAAMTLVGPGGAVAGTDRLQRRRP